MNIKIPVSWLRDYLKTDVAAKTVANYLTACGPSVERVEKNGTDYIFDIEVTTNRPDAFSLFGIAREAHAILKSSGQKSILLNPKGLNTNLDPDTANKVELDAQVTSAKLCPRFSAIVLEIKVQESPAIIRNRLKAVDIHPINNIVDITNYIMMETGQPMHAFDYDKIQGAKMLLRASREGEKLTTLDGVKRNLPSGTIVIQDEKRLIDLCGIMGGENSQITNRTKRIVLFAQSYDPITIRKTTQSLAFRTDAAARFEKGVDLENILPSLQRAVYLAKQTADAKIISELVDIYPTKQKKSAVKLNFEKLFRYLGITIDREKASSILHHLGFGVTYTENILTAQVPSWRTKDTETDVDLIEEIARIYGYHNLPSKLPSGEIPSRTNSILKDIISLKHALKNLGLTETMTYSIISKNMLKTTGQNEKEAVELTNPLTEEWQFMRPTLISSLLDVISKNKYLESQIKIFEIAKTYLKQNNDIPNQDIKIAFAIQHSTFSQIKGLVENLFEILSREANFEIFKGENAFVEQSQSATVKIAGEEIGIFGIINTRTAAYFNLEPNITLAELNLSAIYNSPKVAKSYHPIPKFPPLIEDLSAIYSTNIPVAQIAAEVKKTSALIKNVEVIDIFEDPKLGEGKKSITLRLTYQKPSATPTQEEVNLEREKITKALAVNLLAKVRK